jgi:DNA repair protein RecO (recombination protein O)
VSATERVALESAFVLHGMAYRETSEILDLLTRGHGRVSVVARGMRRPRSNLRSILQPFQPLTVSWSGRGNLFTLRAAEAAGSAMALATTAMMSGFYMNELVIRFLHRGDAHPELFRVYQGSLAALAGGHQPEAVLRRFEMALLSEVGFGLSLERVAGSDQPLDPAGQYQYVIEEGPVPVDGETTGALHFTGSALLAIARGDFSDPEHLHTARQLLRAVLDHHLDGRPLRTRVVFSAMQR